MELPGRRQRGSHELDLVEHELTAVVEQAEVDRPNEAALAVAPVELPGHDHVERSDDDAIGLRRHAPGIGARFATHQEVACDRVGQTEVGEPAVDVADRLLGQDPHR